MKTTVDIPASLYRKAEMCADQQGATVRAVLLNALRDYLNDSFAPTQKPPPRRQRFEIDHRGWPVLKKRPGDATVITEDFVNRLRDAEGV